MEYYSFRNVVIAVPAGTNWKDIVHEMRAVYNKDRFHTYPVMIEEIRSANEDNYNAYIKTQN